MLVILAVNGSLPLWGNIATDVGPGWLERGFPKWDSVVWPHGAAFSTSMAGGWRHLTHMVGLEVEAPFSSSTPLPAQFLRITVIITIIIIAPSAACFLA